MAIESVCTLAIILLLSYIYLRTGKHAMSVAVLPLLTVPGANLVGLMLAKRLDGLLGLAALKWRLLFVALGLAFGVALIGTIAAKLKKTSARRAYLWLCAGFCFLFSCVTMLKLIA